MSALIVIAAVAWLARDALRAVRRRQPPIPAASPPPDPTPADLDRPWALVRDAPDKDTALTLAALYGAGLVGSAFTLAIPDGAAGRWTGTVGFLALAAIGAAAWRSCGRLDHPRDPNEGES